METVNFIECLPYEWAIGAGSTEIVARILEEKMSVRKNFQRAGARFG